jgi:hypothetical protein
MPLQIVGFRLSLKLFRVSFFLFCASRSTWSWTGTRMAS